MIKAPSNYKAQTLVACLVKIAHFGPWWATACRLLRGQRRHFNYGTNRRQ